MSSYDFLFKYIEAHTVDRLRRTMTEKMFCVSVLTEAMNRLRCVPSLSHWLVGMTSWILRPTPNKQMLPWSLPPRLWLYFLYMYLIPAKLSDCLLSSNPSLSNPFVLLCSAQTRYHRLGGLYTTALSLDQGSSMVGFW